MYIKISCKGIEVIQIGQVVGFFEQDNKKDGKFLVHLS
jgi:hypothetical protein